MSEEKVKFKAAEEETIQKAVQAHWLKAKQKWTLKNDHLKRFQKDEAYQIAALRIKKKAENEQPKHRKS